jgi:putative transcriptional regulator
MAIINNIDVMLAKRKMSVTKLAEEVSIRMANISGLKNGKAKAIRRSTLEVLRNRLRSSQGHRKLEPVRMTLIGCAGN